MTTKPAHRSKGYGFIHPNDGIRDVMAHITALHQLGLPGSADSQAISCELIKDKGRYKTSASHLRRK